MRHLNLRPFVPEPGLLDLVAGLAGLAAGSFLLRRWIDHTREQLIDGATELREVARARLAATDPVAEVPEPRLTARTDAARWYPDEEDLDPLGRGEEVDTLVDKGPIDR